MNLLEKIIGVIVRPKETVHEISEKPFIEEAVLIVGITAIFTGISAYLTTNKFIYDYGDIDTSALEFIQTFTAVISVVGPLIGVFIMWIIAAGIVHLISVALGGEGKFTQMLVVYGYSKIPIIINVVIGMALFSFIEPVTIAVTQGTPPNVMSELLSNPYYQASYIISLVMQLWSIGLVFLGVKYIHDLSTGKALIAVALPLLFILFGIIMTVFSSMIFG